MRCKYSFKEFIHSKILANYSFNKFIHSKKSEIIHSMKIFIHLKNGLSPTPNGGSEQRVDFGREFQL